MADRHVGSSVDEFLEEEGIREDVEKRAIKRVLAWQIEQVMREQRVSKSEMVRRMSTSRAQLDRLLDPAKTLQSAAAAVGRTLRLELV